MNILCMSRPSQQELWTASNVHRSETIKLKNLTVGNLVSRHWTPVKQQRNYVSRHLNLGSRH
jgi:hypothetical protein